MAKFNIVNLRSGENIKLTDRELLFVEFYLGEGKQNATKSAIMAGLSEKTARSQGQRMLTKADIIKMIQDRTAPILEALGATADRVLREWAELAFSRPQDGLNKDSLLPIGYQDSHTFKKLMMGEMEVDSHEKTVTFNYSPKIKALTIISEHLGIITKGPKEPVAPVQQITMYNQINKYIEER